MCISILTDEQFNSGECRVDNEIIKIQWLNRIIWIGDKYFRFVNFANFSNGDLVIETTSSQRNKKEFYGLLENGRAFFTKNDLSYSSIEANEETVKYDSEIFVAKINDNNNEEYIISVGKLEHNTELYNLEESIIEKQISTNNFLGQKIENIGTSFNFILDNNNVVFFGFLSSKISGYTFNLNLLNFTSKDIENDNSIIIKISSIDDVYGKRISCFITEANYIICFYLTKSSTKYIPYITAFDQYLNIFERYSFE